MRKTDDHRRLVFLLSALRELGGALKKAPLHPENSRPLREGLYSVLGAFAIGRGVLLLWDDDEGRLLPGAAKGLRTRRELGCPLSATQARRLARSARPFHAQMPNAGGEALAERLRPLMEKAGLQWLLPLGTGTDLAGVMLLGPKIDGAPFSRLELEVLEEMASMLALRLVSARAQRKLSAQVRRLEDMNRQLRQIYFETVHALAGVIDGPEADAEGSYTHSARVAALASEIGRRLGLPEERQEKLYLAGLLHDIGKQLIRREILGKPGPLTPTERRQVQAHAEAGFELINHLSFPWGDVADIIRHHHERLDGQGYPDRLRGEQLSIESKVLMMAEAFDAMTSHQPWRPRLPFEAVVEQIQENLGLQFEPQVVQALCEAVEAGLDGQARQAEFVPNLKTSFDPALIRYLLTELRKQIQRPTLRPAARVIEAGNSRD